MIQNLPKPKFIKARKYNDVTIIYGYITGRSRMLPEKKKKSNVEVLIIDDNHSVKI